jgi:UDP-N-acetylmuramate--alanine ligase
VVTNIDPDHLSNWGSAENYADGFLRFATAASVRLLVTSADDPGAIALTDRVRQRIADGSPAPEIVTFGTSDDADVQIIGTRLAGTGSSFTLDGAGHVGAVELAVPGHYNALNAAAAYAVATWFGVDEADVRRQLNRYQGTYRRFQLIGTPNNIRVYDDYAHHPTEVLNTLIAARTGVGDGRVVVCFQPHLYTRTRDFWHELARALEQADEAIVMDVCGDREDPLPGIDGAIVANAITPGTAHVTYQPVWDEAAPTVARIARPGDLVITVGCGDVTKVAPKIVDEIQRLTEAVR